MNSKTSFYENNESFKGITLDETKTRRLEMMKSFCDELVALDNRITQQFAPFTENTRHATVRLLLPRVAFVNNRRTISLLSSLLSAADSFTISALDGENIRLTFAVENIWKEFKEG